MNINSFIKFLLKISLLSPIEKPNPLSNQVNMGMTCKEKMTNSFGFFSKSPCDAC